ncbi:high affinity cationic amino acid transporter 1-like isoform X2 [Thrips palmi]|uniref:High affinity cationic amino acid transporter 1-like isoform X2 n=1 Tax=Thrips palmi TaxID=161013 RepID=A0A6P8YWF4_THRPL|nr:high affinity cationic amino acid transporter 1-like isoform X2 [Thrips palmi]
MGRLASFWQALTRRKVVDMKRPASSSTASTSTADGSPLARVLTTFDLTALGVGSTLGVGVYVLAGSVARDFAGPAVIISFAVAAVASMLAGLCYAEFGARVPLAGSAYIYSYVSIGEFMAFVIGWNLIMEYVIGCASVARGLSNYLDQLMGNVMQDSFQNLLHLHVSFLSPYIDFFAFTMSFLLSVILAFGVKESMSLNNLFTAVNMAVVLFVIVAGSFKADIANWQIDKSTIPPDVRGGQGGFFPFGFMGVLRGAATCFYGFIGFDCVATTGEEVKNPQRAIPIAIIVSLVIIFFSYFGVSAVLTLMWPYYLQDPDAPLPYVFEQIGWPLAQWTVAIGGIFGLFASLFGAMYPLPRVIYAMANDGLIFKFLGEVHPKYKTPLVGTLLAGVITGIMAALFKLQQLVNMLSIGTLVAYTIVAACVLLLRYRYHESDDVGASDYKETTNLVSLKDKPTFSRLLAQTFNPQGLKTPTPVTSRLVSIEVLLFCGLCVALGLCLVNMESQLMYGHWGPLALVCIISSLLLIIVLSMALQPSSRRELAFKVPLVPVIPAVSILLNIYLILMLDLYTWFRFMIWMAVGVGVYFISLACRKMNWCGSALALDIPARSPVSQSPPALAPNGTSGKNGPSSGISSIHSFSNGCNGSETVVKDEQKSSDVIWRGAPVLLGTASETVLCEPSPIKPTLDDAPDLNDHGRANSVMAGDSDSDVSITDVTNDLLSLTYLDEIKSRNMNTDLKPVEDSAHQEREERPLEDSDFAVVESTDNNHVAIDVCQDVSNNDSQLITSEETDTEDDVRSLYPDVVVISSSEEEIYSRRSSIADNTLVESFEVEVESPLTESCLKCDAPTDVHPSSTDIKTESKPLVFVPVNPMAPADENKLGPNSEVVHALRKRSFVEKLEKLIGAQTLKVKSTSHPPLLRTLSVSSEINISKVQNVPSSFGNFDTSPDSVSSGSDDQRDVDLPLASSPESQFKSPCCTRQNQVKQSGMVQMTLRL